MNRGSTAAGVIPFMPFLLPTQIGQARSEWGEGAHEHALDGLDYGREPDTSQAANCGYGCATCGRAPVCPSNRMRTSLPDRGCRGGVVPSAWLPGRAAGQAIVTNGMPRHASSRAPPILEWATCPRLLDRGIGRFLLNLQSECLSTDAETRAPSPPAGRGRRRRCPVSTDPFH
jgi:hypothetical protein